MYTEGRDDDDGQERWRIPLEVEGEERFEPGELATPVALEHFLDGSSGLGDTPAQIFHRQTAHRLWKKLHQDCELDQDCESVPTRWERCLWSCWKRPDGRSCRTSIRNCISAGRRANNEGSTDTELCSRRWAPTWPFRQQRPGRPLRQRCLSWSLFLLCYDNTFDNSIDIIFWFFFDFFLNVLYC